MNEPSSQEEEPSDPIEPAGQAGVEGPDHVVGERGIASINRTRSLQARISNLLALGLMCSLGVGLLTWYYGHTYARRAQAREAARSVSQAKAQGDTILPPLGPLDPPASPAGVPLALARLLGPAPVPPPQAVPVTPVLLSPRATHPVRVSAAQRALQRQLEGPVFSEANALGSGSDTSASASGALDAEGTPSARVAAPRAPGLSDAATGGSGPLAQLLRPSLTPTVLASVLPTQNLLLPKGAFIDCTLETAIDSSLPGLTTCITATDTFSADGRVVLLERGTKLVGETRGEVQQGGSRVFVLWTEARTPTGVIVPLASPGTDELGRSGLPGAVNRHFLERFGAALLISIIDGAVQTEVASHSGGGGIIYNPTSTEDVMTEVLKGTVNIAPTVIKHNGDRIQVLVARDLDFRSVYELRPADH